MLIESGFIVDPSNVEDWSKIINSNTMRQRLLYANPKPVAVVRDYVIFKLSKNNEHELIAFKNNDINDKVVYYCQIKRNSSRNTLFKSSVGFSTCAVWKSLALRNSRGLAVDIYSQYICRKLIDKCMISDMEQTPNGIRAWFGLADALLDDNWKMYICFSAPGDARMLIEADLEQLYEQYDYVFGHTFAYAFRCCILVKNSVNVESLLNRPKETLILSYEDAIELDAFKKPIPLDRLGEDLYYAESHRLYK